MPGILQSIKPGEQLNGVFAIKAKGGVAEYKNRPGAYFSLTLSDASGAITFKYWGNGTTEQIMDLYRTFTVGQIVKVTGATVGEYNGTNDISINPKSGSIETLDEGEYDPTDFVPAIPRDRINNLFEEVKNRIAGIENPALRALVDNLFEDEKFVEKFKTHPSATRHHHNYIGGNMEHSLSVLRLANTLSRYYLDFPLDNDLIVVGALLHDVGKLFQYEYTTAISNTDEGLLLGHIVQGHDFLVHKIHEIRQSGVDFSETLEMKLQHIIISHHGRSEWGSPEEPRMVEAVIISMADNMDAKSRGVMQGLLDQKDVDPENSWCRVFNPNDGRGRKEFYRDGLFHPVSNSNVPHNNDQTDETI